MKHENDGDTSSNWCTRYSHQMIGTKTGRPGNKWTSGDHPNYSSVETGQNTKKSRRLKETCCYSNSSGKLSVNAGV